MACFFFVGPGTSGIPLVYILAVLPGVPRDFKHERNTDACTADASSIDARTTDGT